LERHETYSGRMSDHVRIWCLRHGESDNVIAGIAGAVPLASLTQQGRDQAAAAAHQLANEPITAVYASTARRAIQTADPIAAAHDLEVIASAQLVEVGIGSAEGSHDPEIRRETALVLRAWVVDQDLDQRVADGESGREVVARIAAELETIAAHHPGTTVALIGHVASLTTGLGTLCDLGPGVWGTPLPHAKPFLIEWDGTNWHCSTWPAIEL
jgi:broad specificity phosphatase PhoE